MPLIELLVLLALAVYRVTRFALRDSLIDRPRAWVHDKLLRPTTHAASDPGQGLRDTVFELIICPFCLSVHFSWVAVLAADHYGSVPLPGVTWLAVAALSMVVWRFVERDDESE